MSTEGGDAMMWYNISATTSKTPLVLQAPRGLLITGKDKFPMTDSECTTKRCAGCEQLYPSTAEYFAPDKRNRSGFQARCKSCCAKWQLEYRKSHSDAVKASELKRDSVSRRIAMRMRYAADPEKGRVRRRKYVKANPDAVRATNQKQRAKRKAIPGEYCADDLKIIRSSQNNKCWWCGEVLDASYNADHRIPLSRGGTNWPENIVLACEHCNKSKHNRMPWEWTGRLL